ncbi:MAG TPA: hypothetical protein VN224_10690 [Xanthomonadales bacterium]|nr:hypothetical protein [Xanthomonadales bacterium]
MITEISHPLATIWLARERHDEASYFYGGTRLIDPAMSDGAATNALLRLMNEESGTKNRIINRAIEDGALESLRDALPEGFLQSRVAGARCLIRPRTDEIAQWLADPGHPDNGHAADSVLARIGDALNEREPRIKLTPDFGRYAGLADILHAYTPNVLGIRCERGGCGGKSSYSTTGVLAGIAHALGTSPPSGAVTCIGSAGAMGSGVLEHFRSAGAADLAVCDLVYDAPTGSPVPNGCTHLPARAGSFTAEALSRGGLIVATTVGDELENSPLDAIPPGTSLFLAHNLALPMGARGTAMAQLLAERGVLVIPGQVLTLGGALTARLEWYWRQLPARPEFDKQLAHRVVDCLVSYVVVCMLALAEWSAITPYEAMLRLAGEDRTPLAVSRG